MTAIPAIDAIPNSTMLLSSFPITNPAVIYSLYNMGCGTSYMNVITQVAKMMFGPISQHDSMNYHEIIKSKYIPLLSPKFNGRNAWKLVLISS